MLGPSAREVACLGIMWAQLKVPWNHLIIMVVWYQVPGMAEWWRAWARVYVARVQSQPYSVVYHRSESLQIKAVSITADGARMYPWKKKKKVFYLGGPILHTEGFMKPLDTEGFMEPLDTEMFKGAHNWTIFDSQCIFSQHGWDIVDHTELYSALYNISNGFKSICRRFHISFGLLVLISTVR